MVDTREATYADGLQGQCGHRLARSLCLPAYFLDFAFFHALPLGLATVCYALIARVLFAGPLPPGDPPRAKGACLPAAGGEPSTPGSR